MPASLRLRCAAALAVVTALAAPATAPAQDTAVTPPAPTVALTAPRDGGDLGAGVLVTLSAEAQNASYVSFHIDGTTVPICLLFTLRSCTWTPTQLGEHTIEARATDALGRTASSSARVHVGRLVPPRVTAATTRRRLAHAWRVTTKGAVAVPSGLTTSACGGVATITVLSGVRTVVDRTARINLDCSFTSAVSFVAPAAAQSVRVKVTFDGAAMLAPRAARTQIVRLR